MTCSVLSTRHTDPAQEALAPPDIIITIIIVIIIIESEHLLRQQRLNHLFMVSLQTLKYF